MIHLAEDVPSDLFTGLDPLVVLERNFLSYMHNICLAFICRSHAGKVKILHSFCSQTKTKLKTGKEQHSNFLVGCHRGGFCKVICEWKMIHFI